MDGPSVLIFYSLHVKPVDVHVQFGLFPPYSEVTCCEKSVLNLFILHLLPQLQYFCIHSCDWTELIP